MRELDLEGISESFVGGWFIDEQVCESVIEDFQLHIDQTHFDEHRGYHRLSNMQMTKDVHISYMKEIEQVFARYQEKYIWSDMNHVNEWFVTQPYNVQKYEPGYNYKHWHIETGGPQENKLLRHLTFMTYLNNIEEGGETEYLYQNLKVKPQKGLTLIWPAGWTHPHRGNPALNEVKYISTGWASFKHRC